MDIWEKKVNDFKSLDNKQDLIWLIKQKKKGKNYSYKKLNEYSKQQLFYIYAKVDFECRGK